MKGNMLIAQSGGPTVAINATLAGAVRRALQCPEIGKVYGAWHGVEGILRDELADLGPLLQTEEDFRRLIHTPAMVLGSCRKRLAEEPDREYETILRVFREKDIRWFFYIGGNDSMDTVQKLSDWFCSIGEEIAVIGVPKTIDNDVTGTDHTPGFGSAARYVAASTAEIACDSVIYDVPTILLIEIMGRNAGWLTAASALARRPGCDAPHMICMPETPFDTDAFLSRVGELRKTQKHLVIAVSEGLRYADGRYVAAAERSDVFGHQQLAGVGRRLEHLLRETFRCKVRAVEPNVLQRAAAHLQSETDIEESQAAGAYAVELSLAGTTGVMVSLVRDSDEPYRFHCGFVDIHEVANMEKKVPVEWIDPVKMDVTDEMVRYLSPLAANAGDEYGPAPVYFRVPKG